MELTPREKDKLLLFTAALRGRAAQGARPEAELPGGGRVHLGRDPGGRARRPHGGRADVAKGRALLGADDVMDGVAELITEVQVEATFPDGTKLVTVHQPIPTARAHRHRRRSSRAERRHRDQRRPRDPPDRGGEHRRPPDPGRVALPLLRGQPGAASSTAPRRAASGWTSRPGRRCASSPGRPARSTSSPTTARAWCTASAAR